MKLRQIALNLLREAAHRVKTAQRAFGERAWAYCVRQSQECVELALKATLRLVGVEYPKVHDVGDVLKLEERRFPQDFRRNVEFFAEVSRVLAEKRELAMYGDEEVGLTPLQLFTRDDAKQALEQAKQVFASCESLIKNWGKKKTTSDVLR
jgi:HEPN domain-containing protein